MLASILIADSSSAIRSVIERAIRVADLAVSDCYQAADAEDVLRLVGSRRIDFLLLDTHLAGIEEKRLVQAVDAFRGNGGKDAAIPFMVTSVDASSARIERLLECGACDYLLKPFSIPTLCQRLETALRTVHANN
jgi:DNA-binding response OmpR family regulator